MPSDFKPTCDLLLDNIINTEALLCILVSKGLLTEDEVNEEAKRTRELLLDKQKAN